MRTHSRWYHTHRDAIGFHGHRFLGMRHLGHHCLCICCLPVVSSIRILHFRSFGFEQSIPQPNLKTKTKSPASLGHRSRQDALLCGARTPMKALKETSTRTWRCRRVLRNVSRMHAHTPKRKSKQRRVIWDGAPCSRTVFPQVHRRKPCCDFSLFLVWRSSPLLHSGSERSCCPIYQP